MIGGLMDGSLSDMYKDYPKAVNEAIKQLNL